MIKATKKELNAALDLAIEDIWMRSLPNDKCEKCLKNYVEECPKCWKQYYLDKAKQNTNEEGR